MLNDVSLTGLMSERGLSGPRVNAVGKAVAKVTIDCVVADCHDVKIADDILIPVDVMVGHTWLELPHVNYYKQGYEMIFEMNCHLNGKELTDDTAIIRRC